MVDPTAASVSFKEIDVRDLPPPEPLERVLEALSTLNLGEVLIMHHRRDPCGLFPQLNGIEHRSRKLNDEHFEIFFFHQHDGQSLKAIEDYLRRVPGTIA